MWSSEGICSHCSQELAIIVVEGWVWDGSSDTRETDPYNTLRGRAWKLDVLILQVPVPPCTLPNCLHWQALVLSQPTEKVSFQAHVRIFVSLWNPGKSASLGINSLAQMDINNWNFMDFSCCIILMDAAWLDEFSSSLSCLKTHRPHSCTAQVIK